VIVVDSSVLIGFFRGQTSPAIELLQELQLENAPFGIPGVCYQEVLQGAKDQKEWALLNNYLGSQQLLFAPDPWTTHREAARIYFDCRRKGITIRAAADCFIAQLTLERDDVLLHSDGDFESIRKVRPLKTFQF